jgi:hypothetical protein
VDPQPDARPEGLTMSSAAAPEPAPASNVEVPVSPTPAVPPTTAPATPAAVAGPAAPAPAPMAAGGEPAPARLTWAERGAVSLADPLELEAALAEVRLARAGLFDETNRLEATLRDAVDIKAKVRRNPKKAAAVAGGAAFLALGGPRRVLRRARRAVFGAPDPLPASLLPDQVERAVQALGDDGSKVRGALEREFASYLASTGKRDRRTMRLALLYTLGPVARQAGVEGVKRLFSAEAGRVEELTERLRQARGGGNPA